MGPETAILVVASNIQEEAPLYFFRIKQAAERGVKLIVLNPRQTKLDRYASWVLRYPYGSEAAAVQAMINALSAKRTELPPQVRDIARSKTLEEAARIFAEADNAVVIYGSEGTSLQSSMALSQACTNLLVATNHIGRVNNGLIGVWMRPNEQGAWDLGFRPSTDLTQALSSADVVYVAGANPIGDNPNLSKHLDKAGFVIVQDLFMTDTAKKADLILPAQSFIEREGTTTNAQRRVQRYYPCIPPQPGPLPDFTIAARIGARLGINLPDRLASQVADQLSTQNSDYSEINYQSLAEVEEQWPIIARSQLYYGGTSYENRQGIGIQLATSAQKGELMSLEVPQHYESPQLENGEVIAFPINVLYDRGQTMQFAPLLESHIAEPYMLINPNTAKEAGILDRSSVKFSISETTYELSAHLTHDIPERVVLIPRSMGVSLQSPAVVKLEPSEPAHVEP
jgi:NADH-quinone oxidoreductase subunit G